MSNTTKASWGDEFAVLVVCARYVLISGASNSVMNSIDVKSVARCFGKPNRDDENAINVGYCLSMII